MWTIANDNPGYCSTCVQLQDVVLNALKKLRDCLDTHAVSPIDDVVRKAVAAVKNSMSDRSCAFVFMLLQAAATDPGDGEIARKSSGIFSSKESVLAVRAWRASAITHLMDCMLQAGCVQSDEYLKATIKAIMEHRDVVASIDIQIREEKAADFWSYVAWQL